MSHGQDFVDRPANIRAHSKCLQAVVCKEAKRPAENLRFG